MEFSEATRGAGIGDASGYLPEAWSASQASYPGAGPAWLEDAWLCDAASWMRWPDELRDAVRAAASDARRSGALSRVLWHAHRVLFADDTPRKMKADWVLPALGGRAALGPLLALLSGLDALRAGWDRRGIPGDVQVHTLSDIELWSRVHKNAHGHWGFPELGWLRCHFAGTLVRLGRLQFMPGRVYGAWHVMPPGVALADGAPLLDIHIPAGEPLDPAACTDSIRRAVAFFPKHYPEIAWQAVSCCAWLLDPTFRKILPATANLVRFQDLFHVAAMPGDEATIMARVFGDKRPDLSHAKRGNTLRDAITAFKASGGTFHGLGFGVVRSEYITPA